MTIYDGHLRFMMILWVMIFFESLGFMVYEAFVGYEGLWELVRTYKDLWVFIRVSEGLRGFMSVYKGLCVLCGLMVVFVGYDILWRFRI